MHFARAFGASCRRDNDFRESQKAFLTALGWQVEDWESPAAFLQDDDLQRPGVRCAGYPHARHDWA